MAIRTNQSRIVPFAQVESSFRRKSPNLTRIQYVCHSCKVARSLWHGCHYNNCAELVVLSWVVKDDAKIRIGKKALSRVSGTVNGSKVAQSAGWVGIVVLALLGLYGCFGAKMWLAWLGNRAFFVLNFATVVISHKLNDANQIRLGYKWNVNFAQMPLYPGWPCRQSDSMEIHEEPTARLYPEPSTVA